ncbi:General alpha-glucoside permease [Ceratocystis lukuohia]|uniref:General alpha-glucoside permease n=1 Tax=Ceratocystis lukuohia TaxID=2019550 RepID=A0ABR4MRP5_9PEZI
MEGFCLLTQGSLYAMPQYTNVFGRPRPNGTGTAGDKNEIPGNIQVIIAMGQTIGQMGGLTIAGYATDTLGFRKTAMLGFSWIISWTFAFFFARNLTHIILAQTFTGIGWGIFQTLGPSYANDIAPESLRPYATMWTNVCWIIGQIMGSAMMRGILDWAWPLVLMPVVWFCPESPRWLVGKGKDQDALRQQLRLVPSTVDDPDLAIEALKRQMHEQNNEESESFWSILQCFKGRNLVRTELATMIWIIQNMCGSTLVGWASYFMKQAGLATDLAFTMQLVMYIVGMAGTFCAFGLLPVMPRRTLYLLGHMFMVLILGAIGVVGIFQVRLATAGSWTVAVLLIMFNFVYNISVGPLTYTYVTLVPSAPMKTKTIAIARLGYCATTLFTSSIAPLQIAGDSWNWGAKSGLFWGACGVCCLIYSYFRVPETEGRTQSDIDELFEQKVPFRLWGSSEVCGSENASGVHEKTVFDDSSISSANSIASIS